MNAYKQRLHSLFLLFLMFPSSLLFGQIYEISGTVVDSVGKGLSGITTAMTKVDQEDLPIGNITDASGQFKIIARSTGRYRLRVSSLGFAPYVDTLEIVKGQRKYALGTLQLFPQDYTSDSVLIEGEQTPVLINGDTVIYNVGSYDTRPNAALEKLLEQLPGIEVAEDGSVTAEGQPVSQIKIDGKEFFGNNVKLAVKNIPVDAVLKVQVTESQSEEAEFSGVDDGQRFKTINLQLKPEKRSGYFGNLSGGFGGDGDTYDRYVGKTNAFRFSPNMQLSVLGITNNVNEVGFGWDQIREFMGGWENIGSVNWSGNNIGIGGVDVGLPTSWGNNDGFITTQAGGINLNYEISDRTDMTATYLYGGATTRRKESTYRENFLSDNTFITEDENTRKRRTDGHAVNLRIRHEMDSTQELTFQTAGSWSKERNDNLAFNRSSSNEGILINSSEQATGRLQENMQANLSLNYRKRFRREGRYLYLGMNGGAGDESTDADISSDTQFLNDADSTYDRDFLLQEQLYEGDTWNYNFYSGFNEPLDSVNFLTFGFNRAHQLEENLRDAFDLDMGNIENRTRNLQLSNHFRRTMEQNRLRLGYRRDDDHLRIRATLNGEDTRLNSEYISEDTVLDQRFFFLLPEVDIRYLFDNDLRIEFEYDTYVREPSLYQLQPFIDNTNPLRVYQGNPGLNPTYYHQFEFEIRRYNRETRKGYGLDLELDYANDAITTLQTVDSLLRQVRMPVNVDRGIQAEGRIFYRHPFDWLKSRFSIDLGAEYNENTVFLNGVPTLVERFSESLRISLGNRDREILGYELSANWSLNQIEYAERASFNRQTFNHRYRAELEWFVNDRLTLASDFNYSVFAGDAFDAQQNLPLLGAEILFYPLKNGQLEIKLSGTDLLNRNLGFRRNTTNTFIEEERVESLTRYFLITATWKLSALGVSAGRKKFNEDR